MCSCVKINGMQLYKFEVIFCVLFQALKSARNEQPGGKKKKAKKGEDDEDMSSGEEVSDSDEAVGAARGCPCVSGSRPSLKSFSGVKCWIYQHAAALTESDVSGVQMSFLTRRSLTMTTLTGTLLTTTMTWRPHLRRRRAAEVARIPMAAGVHWTRRLRAVSQTSQGVKASMRTTRQLLDQKKVRCRPLLTCKVHLEICMRGYFLPGWSLLER